MKGFGIIFAVLSLMAAQALARDCPLESDCFQKSGGLSCRDCKLTKTDPVIMQCGCKTKKQKLVVKEINLSEGIWVYDGAISCYDRPGSKLPGIGKY
ncbi:hypothetical protein CTA2_7882 [Colletotrichum tanaceti]|uniref:Cyanovirin-N domain-containing protein n=1 Tax=Colletotrichum tanaceti TaxID=1306861 RepID=A0A4U6X667_9PEZI|nr:hypothetical protein CTA2_7882 [Colletotrichum tanaceti]TKW50941.1 hypothetical protein CTA1_1361 [Colletotrichum tanaceti]